MTLEPDSAGRLLNRSVTLSPQPDQTAAVNTTTGETLDEVRQHISQGQPALAEHLLLQLRRAASQDVPIAVMLAEFYAGHGRPRAALPLLDTVLAAEPQHLPALGTRARALYALNRAADAAGLAEKIRSLAPDDAGNLNNLGVYQMAGGHFSAAAEAYSAALTLQPDFIGAYHNLLRLPDQQLRQDQLEEIMDLASFDHATPDT